MLVFMKLSPLGLKTFNSVLLPLLRSKFPFSGGWKGITEGRILSSRLAFPGKIITASVGFWGATVWLVCKIHKPGAHRARPACACLGAPSPCGGFHALQRLQGLRLGPGEIGMGVLTVWGGSVAAQGARSRLARR